MTITPPAIHDKNAPPLVHDVTITPPLIHDDSAWTPPLILNDVVITPPLIHDDMTIDDIHDTDNLLQVAILENSVNDFDSLLTCVLMMRNVPSELQTVFSQLCSCLSETGSLDFNVRHALPRISETKTVKHWTRLVNDCLY